MTRELKLALIVGVMLVLGVAVLISDHLAAQRRPDVVTEIPETPALAPAPRSQPTGNSSQPSRLPPPTALALQEPASEAPQQVAAQPAPATQEPLVLITQVTPRVSGAAIQGERADADHSELINEATNRGWNYESGRLRPPPPAMLVSQTQTENGTTQPRQALPQTLPPSPVTQVPTQSPTQTAPAVIHTVVAGDSAFRLAQRYLGDGRHWSRIVEANPKAFGPGGSVQIGAKLTIPGAAPTTRTQPPSQVAARNTGDQPAVRPAARPAAQQTRAPAPAATTNYVVRRGDTLSGIARKELGDARRAGEIIELNRSIIKNPDNLPAGAALRLPAR